MKFSNIKLIVLALPITLLMTGCGEFNLRENIYEEYKDYYTLTPKALLQ